MLAHLFDLFDIFVELGDLLVVLLGFLLQVLHLVSVGNRLHSAFEGHQNFVLSLLLDNSFVKRPGQVH